MATRRKTRTLRGNGRDGVDYHDFIDGVVDGSIRATRLVETTVPDGTQTVTLQNFRGDYEPLPDEAVTVNKRRLTKLEFDDPNG